jgi:hypothetical protein
MQPISLNFGEVVYKVEQLAESMSDNGFSNEDPLVIVREFASIVNQFKGTPTPNQSLHLISSISDPEAYEVDDNRLRTLLSPAKTGVDLGSVIKACLDSAYSRALAPSFDKLSVSAFREGFQEASERFVSLAEKGIEAYPRSPFLKRNQIDAVRSSLDRLSNGVGTREDLKDVLFCQQLLSELIWVVPGHQHWEHHELDRDECMQASMDLQAYAHLVTEPRNLLEEAFEAVQEKYARVIEPVAPKSLINK